MNIILTYFLISTYIENVLQINFINLNYILDMLKYTTFFTLGGRKEKGKEGAVTEGSERCVCTFISCHFISCLTLLVKLIDKVCLVVKRLTRLIPSV